VTKSQKIIIAILSLITVVVLVSVVCVFIFFVRQNPASEAVPVATVAAVQQLPPTALPTPSSTPEPTITPTSTTPPEPTPTSTLVVVETVQPSPTPTRANCVDNVTGFEASGVITDDEVKQFLRDVIPLSHMDGCRGIKYIPQRGQLHGSDLAGSIIPVYREIQVFEVDAEFQTAEQILETVTHEIGHNVHKNIRANNMAVDGRWAALYNQSLATYNANGLGFVSDYARTDKFEDFAETYWVYIFNPQFLKAVNPDKYEFMRVEVFAGVEYSP